MPPEQATARRGKVSRRSDVYSLGAMLYHLLTGRPPFVGEALTDTLDQVLNSEPVSPRLLNPSLPRDLETICLKCLEKEPERRYGYAQELADDLGRWLRHEPIRARPISQWERALKWAKRKPAIAALAATVLLLLTVLAVSSTVAAARIERARRQMREQLYESYLSQARANRLSGRPGRRFDSLEVIKKGAAIRPSPELRDEAIAALALLDLRAARQWDLPQMTAPDSIVFDPRLERYAVETDGNIRVCRMKDDHELSSVPCRELGLGWLISFSLDGRYLAIHTREAQDCVWDFMRSEWAFEHLSGFLGFNPKRGSLAYAGTNGTISLCDLDSREPTRRIDVRATVGAGSFDPGGSRLACFNAQTLSVELRDLETETVTVSPPLPDHCDALAWSADGRLLAAGCHDNCTYVLDGQSGERVAVLKGHQMRVTRLAFNHAGNLLATTSWDGTIRLWDPIQGLPLLVLADAATSQMQFSEDDHHLAYFAHPSGRKFGLLEVAASRVYRRLPLSDPRGYVAGLDLSPDGRLLVAGGRERLCFLDFASGREIGFVAHGACVSVLFHPDGNSLLTSGDHGLTRWPIERARRGQTEEVRIGSPEPVHPDTSSIPMWFACQSADGGTVAAVINSRTGAVVLNAHSPTNLISLAHPGASFVAISPDGKWVATGTWKSTDVKIWEAATGRLEQTLLLPDSEQVLFSPDGRWLITAGGEMDYQLWEVGSWRRRFSMPAGLLVPKFGEMAFSPDSRLVAIGRTSDDIRLLETKTGHPIARIEAPDRFLLSRLCFSRDGCHLLALDTVNNVHVWDLRSLRQILKSMNLDWDMPPYAVEAGNQSPAPLRLEVIPLKSAASTSFVH
jgi:WD40 repeat protein